jgi:hypothetical protein
VSLSLLFTGHMVDKPDRPTPRFPPNLEAGVAARIFDAVSPYAPGRKSYTKPVLGFASGAQGGDILFHECCRMNGIPTMVVLPYPPAVFAETSVLGLPTGDWEQRFWHLWNSTPDKQREVMNLSVSNEAYSACNEHMLELARENGDVHLIALWDGMGGDGPGGAADLVRRAGTTFKPDIFSPMSLTTSS